MVYGILILAQETNLLKVNPLSLKEQPKQIVIQQIERIIRENYTFLGYESFANIVDKAIKKPGVNQKDVKSINEVIKREFSNRLIIIDEVHNMRVTGDSNHKRSLERLNMVAKATSNLKLLLLSATPMYNNHREIIWLLNLMNTNDGNPPVLEREIFDTNGDFQEDGRNILIERSRGYISYVRGENPYVFPYRIYPNEYEPEKSGKIQMQDDFSVVDPYIVKLDKYQEDCV